MIFRKDERLRCYTLLFRGHCCDPPVMQKMTPTMNMMNTMNRKAENMPIANASELVFFTQERTTARRTLRLRVLLAAVTLCVLFALAGGRANAAVKVSFEQKDGDKVSDVVKIVVKPESSEGIDKVEFRVDDKLRYTGTSVPYEFSWDTLEDKEGAHKLTATAFDSSGQTARAQISLTIDNELNTGADMLAQRAQDALAMKDVDAAKRFSRRALKADPANVNAARSLAAIYVRGGDYDRAIDTLDKSGNLDTSSTALLDLASYRMTRALQPDNAAKFFAEAQSANDLRRKAGDLIVADVTKKNMGANTPVAHDAIGDALMSAGRYHEAVAEYGKTGQADDTPVPSINRFALALVSDNRPLEAQAAIKNLQIGKRDDAQSRAIMGLALLRQQLFADARNAVKQDLADHVLASLIVASYADGVTGNAKMATDEANDAIGLAPALGEAQYALALATRSIENSSAALNRAIALSPFQTGPILDYANEQLLSKRQDRYEQALNLTDMALKSNPENVNAKLTQALVYEQQKRFTEALPVLSDLQKKYPQSPDVITAIGVYYYTQGNNAKAQPYFEAARKADPVHFNTTDPPRPLELALRLRRAHTRADFYLTVAALYPAS